MEILGNGGGYFSGHVITLRRKMLFLPFRNSEIFTSSLTYILNIDASGCPETL